MVTIEQLRAEGEQNALYFSLFGVFVLLFFLIGITFGWFLLILGMVLLYIQIQKSRELGSSVLVSDKQFPDIYKKNLEVAKKLSMPMPRVYVKQDPFLNALRKERIPVSIFLVNGIKLQGQVESFDQFVILLKNSVSQLVYKHAVSTIVPTRNVKLVHAEDDGDVEDQVHDNI